MNYILQPFPVCKISGSEISLAQFSVQQLSLPASGKFSGGNEKKFFMKGSTFGKLFMPLSFGMGFSFTVAVKLASC